MIFFYISCTQQHIFVYKINLVGKFGRVWELNDQSIRKVRQRNNYEEN